MRAGSGTGARDPRGGSGAGGGARGRPPTGTGPLAHRRPRPSVRSSREQVAAGGGRDPRGGGWASESQRVPDSSSFLSNFLIILATSQRPDPPQPSLAPQPASGRGCRKAGPVPWRGLGLRPVTRGEGPPSPAVAAALVPTGRGHALSSCPSRRRRSQAQGPGARVTAPEATGRNPLLAPTHPANDPAAHARSGLNAILFGRHSLDGDFCKPLSLWRPRREARRVCFYFNDSGIFNNPLLGPSIAEGALPWRGSGGLLFHER